MWDKDIVNWKIRSRGLCLAHNQDFARQGEGLNPHKSINVEIGRRIEQISVTQTHHRRDLEAKPPAARRSFCNFLGKLAIVMPLDHNSHVLRVT